MNASLLYWLGGGLLSVLLACALAVGTWAALRTGRTAQIVANYKGAAESAQALAESLQAEMGRMKNQHAAEVADLQQQLRANGERMHAQDLVMAELRDMITGASMLDRLTGQLGDMQATMLAEFQATRQLVAGTAGGG